MYIQTRIYIARYFEVVATPPPLQDDKIEEAKKPEDEGRNPG